MLKKTSWLVATAIAVTFGGAAQADWKPTKPVEFVVTSAPGGGTDNFARVVQSIIAKHKLMEQPIVVTNKGGGSGAEGFIYAKVATGDSHKLTFGTNNAYLLPYVAKLAYKPDELTPVAAMALDEFLLWVKADAPYKDAKSYIEAVKAKPDSFKMGGSQSKDTDQTLTSLIQVVPPLLAQPPLCVFSPTRLQGGAKVTATMGWSDIPTCKEAGIPIDQFQMPRTVWLPGGVPSDAAAFYAGILKKVNETPEWKEYIERTSQTDRFLAGEELKSFIASDDAKNRKVFEQEGWVVR